jgi:hypothetical protein
VVADRYPAPSEKESTSRGFCPVKGGSLGGLQ